MAETAQDIVNRALREFKRYTGDGLPGEPVNAPLPVGDPQSGVWNPRKRHQREALLATLLANSSIIEVIQTGGDENDIVAQVAEGSNVDRALVFFMRVAEPNTGPVTLTIGDDEPREMLNVAGNPLAAGEWTGAVMFARDGQGYRLLLDAGAAESAAQSANAAQESGCLVQPWKVERRKRVFLESVATERARPKWHPHERPSALREVLSQMGRRPREECGVARHHSPMPRCK